MQAMGVTSGLRGGAGPRPVRRFRRYLPLLIGASVLAGLAVSGLPQEGWHRLRTWRAQRFTAEGFAAWKAGMHREAELAFASAEALDRSNVAALFRARMLLQLGRRAEGRKVFIRELAAAEAGRRDDVATLYFDTLAATGWFEELARFCVHEQALRPSATRPHWQAAALEAARISRIQVGSSAAAMRSPDAYFPRLWEARLRLNSGDAAGAAEVIEGLRGVAIEAPLAWSAGRLAAEAGLEGWARTLSTGARQMGPDELALRTLLADDLLQPAESGSAARLIFAQAFPPSLPEPELMARLNSLLGRRGAALPGLLLAHFGAGRERLSASVLTALWLLTELNQPAGEKNPWTTDLHLRTGVDMTPITEPTLSAGRFQSIVNTLPCARETVIALMALVPAGGAQ